MSQSLIIEAPSRLHFGMFAFGGGHRRQFGGVGLMVREPRLVITLRPAANFACTGLHADRSERIARQVAANWLGGELPACKIAVRSGPPEHSGLGLGTQLSLAIAVGLARLCTVPDARSPEELSVGLGRARRSSVGTHGFVQGGLIIEAGHLPGEPISPLVHREAFPTKWPIVLLLPRESDGLSGSLEAEAFAELPAVPLATTGQLTSEVLLEMLPALRGGDFAAFAESVYRFGRAAGECFAAIQGGAYARRVAPIVERLRDRGIRGVGQSSWGPAVFAFAENEEAALELSRRMIDEFHSDYHVVVTRADNTGVVLRPLEKGST